MNGQGIAQFIPLILIFVIFYFFLIRPQQKRAKDHLAMVASLKRGDEVITSGGIIGTVERVMEDDRIEVNLGENIKVQIIKSLAISQFVLPATLLVVPQVVCKTIESMLYEFLWGRKDKVSRIKVNQDLINGGLNMIDIESLFMSFKASWIPKLLNANPTIHAWSQLPYVYFKQFLDCNDQLVFNVDKTVEFYELKHLCPFYKEAFKCYNEAFVYNLEEFATNFFTKSIWGNKFIFVKRKRKKCVLFLRNWVRSGIRYIRDLRFVNGILDIDYVLKKVIHSTNIWAELFMVKNALLPYREYLCNIDLDLPAPKHVKCSRSKEFYVIYKEKSASNVQIETKYLMKYVNDRDDDLIRNIYLKKIIQIKEMKLKEFNFKMLHGILPCNLNLFRWKIRLSYMCDVCQDIQSIEHLIFSCTYVKPLWETVSQACGITIDHSVILGLNNEQSTNIDFIVTLICFLIYKEWLLLSLDNKYRRNCINLDFYKCELELRLEIYKHCSRFHEEELHQIELLINSL